MLLYKQGRFYAGGISFVLPDNSCLVIFEAQNYYENGLEITDPQESMVIDISLDYAELPSKDVLDDILEGDSFKRLSETVPICIGGLRGHRTVYEAKYDRYCEYRFELPEYDEINSLEILIRVEKGGTDIFEAINSELVLQLFNSIRKEA